MSTRLDAIRRLEDEARHLVESDENKRRLAMWESVYGSVGIPRTDSPLFTVSFERATLSRMLNFSFEEFYIDPYTMIEGNLKIMIFHFKTFEDCKPIFKSIAHYPGVNFEKSLFGGESSYFAGDAWLSRKDVFPERIDIGSLEPLDFHKSGSMPEVHELYGRVRELLSEDFESPFPQWTRSPFGTACHLRGFENLLIDLIEDEDWVLKFLNYLTDCRIKFTHDREKFLNRKQALCHIANDEINSPLISPETYANLILPTELRIGEEFGGVYYWHSCGDTTPFVADINKLPGLKIAHVSAWTDFSIAEKSYDKSIVLEKQLHPYQDLYNVSDFKRQIKAIADGFNGSKGIIRPDSIQATTDFDEVVGRAKNWCSCARYVLF